LNIGADLLEQNSIANMNWKKKSKDEVGLSDDSHKLTNSNWSRHELGEIAKVVGGGTPSTKDNNNFGENIPWLTPKDLSAAHYRIVSKGNRNLSLQGLQKSSAKLVPKGSVIVSTRAPIGYVAIAGKSIATNQGIHSLVLDNRTNSDFIYYWLKLNTELLKQQASGSTFQEINSSNLKRIQILLPPINVQHAIAHILGTLDDKIELNRQMNKTLEAMAKTLFKSWFVDFDPVRAKNEGRETGLPRDIADHFPDRLVDSEMGKIPEGWKIGQVDDNYIVTMGQSPPGYTYNEIGEGTPFFQGSSDFSFRFPQKKKILYCSKSNG